MNEDLKQFKQHTPTIKSLLGAKWEMSNEEYGGISISCKDLMICMGGTPMETFFYVHVRDSSRWSRS